MHNIIKVAIRLEVSSPRIPTSIKVWRVWDFIAPNVHLCNKVICTSSELKVQALLDYMVCNQNYLCCTIMMYTVYLATVDFGAFC